MGRNSYLGGSTVIRPGSSWFSKPKKKEKRRPRTQAQLQALREAKATETHQRQVMMQLRQGRIAAERQQLSPKARRLLRAIEDKARRDKAEKKRKREEVVKQHQERKSAQKRARLEQARLQQEKKAAEQTARKLLHEARIEAVRLSKASRLAEAPRTTALRNSRGKDRMLNVTVERRMSRDAKSSRRAKGPTDRR